MAAPKKMKVQAKEENFQKQHETDAGFDLRLEQDINLMPGSPEMVTFPVKVAIPKKCVGLLFIRSSIGKRGVTLANSVGVIDSDYRGYIKAALINQKRHKQTLFAGERIAQLVVLPLQALTVEFVEQLDQTERGEGGFGSTNQKEGKSKK